MQNPIAVAVTAAGTLYVVDRGANRVRKVSSGVITAVAGTGAAGSAGTGGPATSAQLDGPSDVVIDAAGSLYVADSSNSRVVKVDPAGTLQVVAGTGTYGVSGNGGPAASATFEFPRALAFSPVDGSLYVSDQNADLVRRLSR